MANKLKNDEKWVYKFTKPTIMKFQPKKDFQAPSDNQKRNLIGRIKNFFSPQRTKVDSPKNKKSSSAVEEKKNNKATLKFIKRLTNQHILIGNQDQLDVLNISYIIQDFVDTQFYWSLSINKAIQSISIDYKKSFILLLADNQVFVYAFDHKSVAQKAIFLHSVRTKYNIKYIHVIRQATFVACGLQGMEIFVIDQNKGIKKTLQKKFVLPHDKFKLFSVPQPYQNTLNVFFEDYNHDQAFLRLWVIEVSCHEKQVNLNKATKVYDISSFHRPSLKIQNYSKNCFMIISTSQIIAFKNGYKIEPPEISIQSGNNYFKHLSQNKLVHISDSKAQIYNLTIDSNNPPKMNIKDFDSVYIPSIPQSYEFVDSVDIMNDNFVIIYQTKQEDNRFTKGELFYAFIVTHLIKIQDKIKEILPATIKGIQIEEIQQKADMVKKMGLSRKQIYLRLWNNSQKKSIEDFKILLDTLDYDVIKLEIEKKLKKNSMNFRQIILLQQGCLAMLHENIRKQKPTKQDIKNYFISHYFIRKLQLYKQISMIEKQNGKKIAQDEEGKLLIDIQNYNYYKTIDIKGMLYQYILRFTNEDKNAIAHIRAIIKHFNFALRIDYQSILKEIILNNKKKLIKLLQLLPQLLPIPLDDNDKKQGQQIFTGVWGRITEQQWQSHIYTDTVQTIFNKQILRQLVSGVWYKRQWLTQHDFIYLNRGQILKIYQQNYSEWTFYNVIEYIFDTIKEYTPLKAILGYIQDHFTKMPQHIYGKIFLYHKIYNHLKQSSIKHNKRQYQVKKFGQFLKFRDQDIFKQLFIFEKIKKGFILKQVQAFYIKLACKQAFNEGLLNYLASDKSQVSDIKYLLNRLNNQKQQFLKQNQGIYQVLIRGMQAKLKIGSENDIPISQVLIYIQTIHLSQQTKAQQQMMAKVMKDLEVIALIEEYYDLFKKAKLNMSIFQITKNPDNVIAAVINYYLADKKFSKINNVQEVINQSKRILQAAIQIKDRLYNEDLYKQMPVYCFLTTILQDIQMIPKVAILLQDQWFNNNEHFTITQKFVENVVIYVYKWRMSTMPCYSKTRSYIKELINLLPSQNKFRTYAQAEIQFTHMLQSQEQYLQYPLCNDKQQFNTIQFQNTIRFIPGKHLLTIDIPKLYQCALAMQEIGSDHKVSEITLYNTYQIIVIRLIECEIYKEVIEIIRKLIKVQENTPYNFIYPSMIVAKLAPELIEENRYILLKCTSYLFYKPGKLLDILDDLMKSRATNFQYKQLLLRHYKQVVQQNVIYNLKCPLLEDRYFFLFQQNAELKSNYIYLLRHTLLKIFKYHEQFNKAQYYIIYMLLCNDPYTLIKYLYINRYELNIKDIRRFLSFLIKEDVFKNNQVLQFGKRMFYIIYKSMSQHINIEHFIQEQRNIPLDTTIEIQKDLPTPTQFLEKMKISILKFKNKIKMVHDESIKMKRMVSLNTEQKINKYIQRLNNPKLKQQLKQYNFHDSDDDNRIRDLPLKRSLTKNSSVLDSFDEKFNREALLNRNSENIREYISIKKEKTQKSLYYAQKYAKDSIYGTLTVNKGIQTLFKDAITQFMDSKSPQKIKKIDKTASQSQKKIKTQKKINRAGSVQQPLLQNQEQQGNQQIQNYQHELLIEQKDPEIGDFMAGTIHITKILQNNPQITENKKINFSQIDVYRANQRFSQFLKDLVVLFYQRDLQFKKILIIISQMKQQYPQLMIKKNWLDVYMRALNLQNKFSLNLPLREILIVEGLFLDSQMNEQLFYLLQPKIIKHLNDQNIMKICKVITLAFKKPTLEQQILLSYLITLCQTYQNSIYVATNDASQLSKIKQKISVILQKIPVKLLYEKQELIVRTLIQQETKRDILMLILISLEKRFATANSGELKLKYSKILEGKRIR